MPDSDLFSHDTADWPAEAASRRYPITLTADGIDANGSARAAYAAGLADGLTAATP